MKCVCGNTQCFVCSQKIQDYNHFREDKCPLFNDTTERLRREVATAQERAIREFTDTDIRELEVAVEPELEVRRRQITPVPLNHQQDEYWPWEQSVAKQQGPQQQEAEYFRHEGNELEGRNQGV